MRAAWDGYPAKPQLLGLVALGWVALWLASAVLRAVDRLPLLGDAFVLVGFVYSLAFTRRCVRMRAAMGWA